MNIRILLITLLVFTALFSSVSLTAHATGDLPTLIPEGCTGRQASSGDCGVAEAIDLGVRVYNMIFAIVGSVTLLMFIYGGLVWVTSTGNAQRVEHGKKIFEGALVGLVIIFASWIIINFVVAALTGQKPGKDVKLFQGTPSLDRPIFNLPR